MSDVGKDFYQLSKALKAAGEGGLRKKLNKGIRKAAKPLIADVKQAEIRELPHRGGAGKYMAGKRTRIVTRTGKDPGIKVFLAKYDPRLEASGRLAHPVFNRKDANGKRIFAVQKVKPGIIAAQLDKSAPKVVAEVEAVIKEMYREVIREVGH